MKEWVKMDQIWKNASHLEKRVTEKNRSHLEKWVALEKNGLITVGKRGYTGKLLPLGKWVTLEKMCHRKNWSQREKWVTFGKMDQT